MVTSVPVKTPIFEKSFFPYGNVFCCCLYWNLNKDSCVIIRSSGVIIGSFSDNLRIIFESFSDNVCVVFGSFSDRFRIVFGPFSDRFGPFSHDSILDFKISNFNWPGLGPRRGRPPFRPVGADRRSEASPSPGQLKFEFWGKIETKTKVKTKTDATKGSVEWRTL